MVTGKEKLWFFEHISILQIEWIFNGENTKTWKNHTQAFGNGSGKKRGRTVERDENESRSDASAKYLSLGDLKAIYFIKI